MSRLSVQELLAAETALAALSAELAEEYQAGGAKWEREWMQKHLRNRLAVFTVRDFLVDRAEEQEKQRAGGGTEPCGKG